MSNSRFVQGTFVPKNPQKYVGDVAKIRYMSSYELQMHNFLDNNDNVIQWSSEELAIPYIKPTDGKLHKYYPDYWVKYMSKDGTITEEIIEVKPYAQTRAPRKNSKNSIYEQVQAAVNLAKWSSCKKWCSDRGIKFRIITERTLFA